MGLFGNWVVSKANTLLISQLNGCCDLGFYGIYTGRAVCLIAFVSNAVADKGKLKKVELFLAHREVAAGQTGKAENIPAGQ